MSDRKSKGGDLDPLDLAVVERRAASAWGLGRTRRVRVTYGCTCGTLAGAEAVAVLDVSAEPDLADDLLAGTLNSVTCPACGADQLLRLPVTVHDPKARRVVICAGEGDRHRALALLIRYFEGLRDQPGDSVPAYALEPEIAFGRAGWRQRLEAPGKESTAAANAALERRARELEERALELQERSASLELRAAELASERAELDSRQGSIEDRLSGLERAETELEERERRASAGTLRLEEWETRLREEEARLAGAREEIEAARSALEDREALAARREEDLGSAEEDLARRAVDVETLRVSVADRLSAAVPARPEETLRPVLEADPEKVPEPEAAPSKPARSRPEARRPEAPEVAPVVAPAVATVAAPAGFPPPVEELPSLLADDEEEPDTGADAAFPARALDPDTEVGARERAVEVPRRPSEPVLEIGEADIVADAPEVSVMEVAPEDLEDRDSVEPVREDGPTEAIRSWIASGRQALAAVDSAGEVRLYRRHDAAADPPAAPALACRLFVHEERPWLQVVLADEGASPIGMVCGWLVRLGGERDDAAALRLAERFEADVVEVDGMGGLHRRLSLSAPLAANVAAIRAAAREMPAADAAREEAAADAARADGSGWLDRSDLPAIWSAPPSAPGAIQQAMIELAPWLVPEEERRLVTQRSVPVELWASHRRGVLSAAIAEGLSLPPEPAKRAVAEGLAPSSDALATTLWNRFFERTARRGDLDRDAVLRNWRYLCRELRRAGGVVDPGRQAVVDALLDEAGMRDEGASPGGGIESAGGDLDLLLRWIAVRSARRPAIEAILLQRPMDRAGDLAAALDALPPADLVEALMLLRGNEDLLAEVFMAGLSAEGRALRLAAAAGLGKMALRRAVVPLVHQLLRADGSEWRFVGAAIAAYGATGVRAMEPMLGDPRGGDDRLAWTLAAFSGAAAEKQVAALRGSGELLTAAIARRSPDWRNDVEQFRERQRSAEGRADAAGFVHLVARIVAGGEAGELAPAVESFRPLAGMDI